MISLISGHASWTNIQFGLSISESEDESRNILWARTPWLCKALKYPIDSIHYRLAISTLTPYSLDSMPPQVMEILPLEFHKILRFVACMLISTTTQIWSFMMLKKGVAMVWKVVSSYFRTSVRTYMALYFHKILWLHRSSQYLDMKADWNMSDLKWGGRVSRHCITQLSTKR